MKKRTKSRGASIPKSLRQQSTSYSAPTIVRRARDYPLLECWISASWQKDEPGLVEIVVARQQLDDNICFGVYLVDKLCLGLKNTFAKANFSPTRYEAEVDRIFDGTGGVKCPPELAYQMVYASIDYAAQFGFTPQVDFEVSQFMLAPRGEFRESYKLKFGKKGKPLYISGPDDNVAEIVKQLERTAGPGKFDFIDIRPGMF